MQSLTPQTLFLDEPLRAQLGDVLDAAIAKAGAVKGNVQIFDATSGTAEIVVQRGFGPEFLHYFRSVSLVDGSACARAWLAGARPELAGEGKEGSGVAGGWTKTISAWRGLG